MMLRFSPFVISLWALLFSPSVLAADAKPLGLDIVAVVNDRLISSYDVDSRVRFVILTSHLNDTSAVREGIRPQIVRTLIDEHLQVSQAEKEKITIDKDEVEKAIASIEKKRGMPEGAIMQLLTRNHIPADTFTDQIRAQLAWGKIVMTKIRPDVKISEEEVRTARIKPPAEVKNQELRIAVLLLPVDKPAREPEVQKLAQKLSGELRGGASYEEVYRQFSGLPSGAHPDTFWVKPEQLDPIISQALVNAVPDMVTMPLRSRDGYLIVKVYNTRSLEKDTGKNEEDVVLKEILLRLKPDASGSEADVLLKIGEEVAKHPGTCVDEGVANIENLKDVQIDVSKKQSRLSELPAAVRIIAENLRVGDISTPFASSEGIRLYMLCEKKTADKKEVELEQLGDLLFQRKLELEAQKYLRNLRREAFIEVRG